MNDITYCLIYKSYREGRALSFPCDAQGHVPLDGLSDRARTNYFYARTTVGREFRHPVVGSVRV